MNRKKYDSPSCHKAFEPARNNINIYVNKTDHRCVLSCAHKGEPECALGKQKNSSHYSC